jgi:DNA repair protein RecO (recombination protein O)
MALHKDEAIILSKRAYGESDKIMRLFTLASGKIAAIAKGASKSQKRFMNTLEPFNHIRVEYFEKQARGMVRIENADLMETGNGIETSLKKVSTAAFFVEFVDRLTKERERHDDLFHILREILRSVKHLDFAYADILYYELKMLETLGYIPNFYACVYCGNDVTDDKKVSFSRERGGILCPKCSRFLPHKAYPEAVIPKVLLVKNGKTTGKDRTFEVNAQDIMEGFMSFHLDVEFKSYRILKAFF